MEKKNTILLTVIAVATLLVAVVGATFAYFTATTGTGDDNETAETGTTTTIGGVNLTMTANNSGSDIAYPGGYVVAGVTVSAENTDDANDYTTTFDVNGTITNNTATELKWYLYESTTEIPSPVTADSCQVHEEAQGDGTTRYWYTGCKLDSALSTTSSAIANSTVPAATESVPDSGNYDTPGTATVSKTGEVLKPTAGNTATTYYYLVVEYPNNDASQDADQGKTIVAQLTNVSNGSSVVTQEEP